MPKATTPRQEPLRRRISIPQVDTSTQQWWEAQDDPSVSIRLLIREEIEKNGYVDKLNHPVEQQPRRGRPPAAASASGQAFDDDAGSADGTESTQSAASTAQPEPKAPAKKASPAKPDAQPRSAADPDPEPDDADASVSALDDLMNN